MTMQELQNELFSAAFDMERSSVECQKSGYSHEPYEKARIATERFGKAYKAICEMMSQMHSCIANYKYFAAMLELECEWNNKQINWDHAKIVDGKRDVKRTFRSKMMLKFLKYNDKTIPFVRSLTLQYKK